MIIFKSIHWSHAFSYGANNYIDFTKSPLLQLIGKNGNGKSSIALVLEEVLFNKNSKGMKKASILNRYSSANTYEITLDFSIYNDNYTINTVRGSTQKVTLYKNKQDISAHTSTATYKLIEQIIGMDHKTFTQIVYQSNAFSLEFLTATDSNRKKFLIDLWNLAKYTLICDKLKATSKDVGNTIEVANMKQNTVLNWLTKFSKESVEEMDSCQEPDSSLVQDYKDKLAHIVENIATISNTNKRIIQNNKYKEILSTINITAATIPTKDLIAIRVALKEHSNKVLELKNTIRGIGPILTKCPSCGQVIDSSHKKLILEEAKLALPSAEASTLDITKQLEEAEKEVAAYNKSVSSQAEWERYYSFIDNSLPTNALSINTLNLEKSTLESYIDKYNKDLKTAQEYNNKVAAHNAKVKVLLEQMISMQEEKLVYTKELEKLTQRLTNLQILVKAFGTSGLVAYKIECLVKDLEEIVNEYLQSMSDGRFQLGFEISSSDRLDVVITDDGKNIEICDLSNGELARVNISTLLGIRKLMQSLSDTRVNLLILDETIENLDVEGKEKLVEVLLKEEGLNTILVSHGWNHPIIEKVIVTKDNNISRIEQ
jgi:DNA repair exonuclease SbcCD ATPase subunit